MIRRYNNRKNEGRDLSSSLPHYSSTPVMIKSKDVVCGFCKHRFYIGKELKGHNSPLLLPCGHASCTTCESMKPYLSCPQCPNVSRVTTVEKRQRLPYHMYVVGVVHTLMTMPLHAIEEPDFSFHIPPNALARQQLEKGHCQECGMIAFCECKTCDALFCKACYKKIHKRVLKNHEAVPLNKIVYELPLTMFCPNHDDGEYVAEYYCEDCDFEGCSHCIFRHHKEHKAYAVSDINGDAIPEFDAALEKLNETWKRIRHTKKNLTSKMVSAELNKASQQTELTLTQHFIYLHGVLQNLEAQLKDRLHEQRDTLKADIEAFRDELSDQEDKLAMAYVMAATAKDNPNNNVNVKKLTERLLDLADSPCHLMVNNNYDDQIRMKIDPKWIDNLKLHHIQLHVPENPKFTLLRTHELPTNYELEYIESDENLNMSIRGSFRRDSPSPLPSIASCGSPANQSFEEPITSIPLEPSSLARGTTERVKITCFNDPTDFYVLKKSDVRLFEEMQMVIDEYLKTNIEPPSVVNLNSLYIVQNSKDFKWYRGRVTHKDKSCNNQMLYEIYYIDLGSRDYEVSIDRMRKLVTGINIAPGMALHCTLDEIVPIDGGEWDEDVLKQYADMLAGQMLHMTILRTDGPKLTVDLKINNGNQEMCIRELLLVTQRGKINSFHKLKRINPLSAHQFYYEDLPMDTDRYVRAKVLNVVSPNCIYVKNILSKGLAYKMKQFQTDYSRALKNENLSIKCPEIGDTVALEEELMYYRGYVTNIMHQKSKLEVFLVDTGETKTVKYSQVTRLPHRFCEWTAQAIKVSLVDIEPAEGGTYSEKAIRYLQQHLTNQSVKILPISKSGNAYGVAMLTFNETNVNANLVSINFAVSTGQYSKHATLNNDIRAPIKLRKKQYYKPKVGKVTSSDKFSYKNDNLKADSEKRKLLNKRSDDVDPFRVRVLLHKVISPDEIYVSEAANTTIIENMNQQMQKFYAENRAECKDELESGLYYCVYSRKDNQYCRAMYLEMSPKKPTKARMLLIDLAETIEVDINEIQPLNTKFLEVPKHMFRIKLAGVTPCGGSETWPSSSCRKLKEIIEDSGCDTKYYITLAGSAEKDEIIPVDLLIRRHVVVGPTEPNRRESISVKRRLIEDGHAFPIRGYDDDKEKELAVELKKKLKLDTTLRDSCINIESTNGLSKNNLNLTPIEEETVMNDGEGDVETSRKNYREMINDYKEAQEEENDEEKNSETEDGEDDKADREIYSIKDTSNDLFSLPPKVQNWIPAAHLIQDELIGKVTYVGYNGEVYFHPDTKEYYDTLNYIKETLDRQYRDKTIKKYDTSWEVGDLCIANYHVDGKWYRAKVIDVTSKHKIVSVTFVDYGNVEDCQIGALKKRIILTEIPIQITCATIAGLKPEGDKWQEADLDVIHKVLVDKKVRIKILSRPPKTWKAAFWIIDGNKTISVPWYIQNKTQVKCITDDIITIKMDVETEEMLSDDSLKIDYSIQSVADESGVGFDIPINENDSDDSSEYESLSKKSIEIEDDSDDDHSDTIKSLGDVESENTVKMNNSSLSNETNSSSNSGRKQRLALTDSSDIVYSPNNSADLENGNKELNGIEEQLLSGNSIYLVNELDINFDIQSVKSEAFNSEINYPLIASTPLNTSYVEDDIAFGPKDIDFFKYKLRDFQISIGQASTPIQMSGYIVDCTNKELKAWIEKNKIIQEEIQLYAKEQPLLAVRTGVIGIAKYSDKQWYRAQITNKSESGITVEFIDFGNCMLFKNKNKLRTARKEWLEVPRLSFNFKFYNVRIPLGRHQETHNAVAVILNQHQVLTAYIKEYEPVLGIELYLDKGCRELAYSSLIKNGLLEVIDPEVD